MKNDKLDTNLLPLLESDEFLPPVSRWAKLTGLVLAGTIGAAFALSAFIKYNSTVEAAGMIRPAGELQVVEAVTQGKVKSVEVKENQEVKAGDAIAKVDEAPLQSQKTYLKKQVDQLSAQLAQTSAQINQYRAGKSQSGNIWYVFRRYRTLEEQLNNTQSQYYQVSQMLENSTIRTPISGKVLKLDIQNVGQQVKSGQQVAQIFPSNTSMVVKARVAAQDIAQVEVGQSVQLRISAYPYPDYGVLQGKVSSVGADAVTPQNNTTDPSASYYEVTIQPEKSYLVKNARQYSVQPGMEVTANIISREETVLTFILRKARLMTNL